MISRYLYNFLVSKKACRPNTTPQLKPIMPNVSQLCSMRAYNAKRKPNARQWNMVRVGYARVWFALGMHISCCLCQFHFVLDTQHEPVLLWNIGYRVSYFINCKGLRYFLYSTSIIYHRMLGEIFHGPGISLP